MSMALCLACCLVLGRADVDAQAAAGAIVGRDLERELPARDTPCPAQSVDLKPAGAPAERRGIVDLHADRGVRADQRAQAALDADLRVPDGDVLGDARASRTCVVPVGKVPSTGKALTGRSSPRLAIIMPSTSLTNAGALSGTGGTHVQLRGDLGGHLHLVQGRQGAVDRGVVPLDDRARRPSCRRSS